MNFTNVTIFGAGTMGHSIALLFATGGHDVILSDTREAALDEAKRRIAKTAQDIHAYAGGESPESILSRITYTMDGFASCPRADLVIEVISENTAIKRQFYETLAGHITPTTLITSNTSVLNIFEHAPEKLHRQLMMAHYFIPPHLTPLVEVVRHPSTDDTVVEAFLACLRDMGMIPIVLKKFARGFIINRIQRAFNQEIFQLIHDGVADAQDIDAATSICFGRRLAVIPYLSRIDSSGLDLVLNNYRQAPMGLVTDETPPALLEEHVSRNELGIKTGKGFYVYGEENEELLRRRDARLHAVRKFVEQLDKDIPYVLTPARD